MTAADERGVRMLCTGLGRASRRLLRWDGNLQCFDMSDINMVHYAAALHLIHKRIREENCLECTKEN